MPYQQTTTANPYGFRPWRTRLYTTFDDFSFLKQPQNTIIREPVAMKPQIYKPPEMKGLGDVLVTGSGRVVRGRRRSLRGLGVIINADPSELAFPRYSYPISPIIMRGPISTGPVMPGPMPVLQLPPNPPAWNPPPPVPVILPPGIVPPPPTVVSKMPGGTVYSLPGAAGVPGSPFPPPSPSELPAPGAPITPDTTVATGGSLAEWFNSQTWISGIPNGFVALGGVAALWYLGKRGRR